MAWLFAGYAAFFLLTAAYILRLALMRRGLRLESERLGARKEKP